MSRKEKLLEKVGSRHLAGSVCGSRAPKVLACPALCKHPASVGPWLNPARAPAAPVSPKPCQINTMQGCPMSSWLALS